jgi:hypothetical protein
MGSTPSHVVVTRSGTAYTETSAKKLSSIAANTGRFDYSNGATVGMYLETSASTNVVADPESPTHWLGSDGNSPPNGTTVTFTANNIMDNRKCEHSSDGKWLESFELPIHNRTRGYRHTAIYPDLTGIG